ncbi:MAG: hypothetical protein OSB03_17640 [Vicinamibacterales bacterium]|nr:hypothetical protein [Vicinamibacterales bacterium]
MGRDNVTTHGFRSSFRDWAAERTDSPRAVCEATLAHTLKDKTEAAWATFALGNDTVDDS